jgi:hypothetical protein
LFTPVFTRIVAQAVKEGIFRTFDPEGVADMILQLGGATRDIVARALAAGGGVPEMNRAIRRSSAASGSMRSHRILERPDGSVRLTERGYVRAVMAARQAAGVRPGRSTDDAATKRPAPPRGSTVRVRRRQE